MTETFYKRTVSPGGRVRYLAVSEYNSEVMDSLPAGSHLIQVYPGGRSTKYNIDPGWAPMIAAGRVAEETISYKLMKASDLRLSTRGRGQPITEAQRAAWENLIEEFGEGARQLEWPAAREITEAAVAAMMEEAQKILENPSVREAWEQFQTICLLTREDSKR